MRTLPSQDPVVRPVRTKKTFDKVKLGRLVLNSMPGGTTNLTARFDATDGSEVLSEHSHVIRLPDLGEEENNSPLLTKLLNRLTGVLGLFYKREVLREKLWKLENQPNGEEPSPEDQIKINQLKLRLTKVESDLGLEDYN